MTSALIYAIHRTQHWWSHVGRHMGFDQVTVLTDRRGDGDRWITDDYYAAWKMRYRARDRDSELLSCAEIEDVIARCRVLRWQDRRRAVAMVLAMADAMEIQLDAVRPGYVVSMPIDNYNQDVLARLCRKRGLPYFEITISALPDMCMLMHRGRLMTTDLAPDPALVDAKIREIADPLFTPSYIKNQSNHGPLRFLKILGYFRVRAAFFKLYSWWRRDPLNTHYLDAQPSLGHKAKWSDVRITRLVEPDWEEKLQAFPRERRVLFGLQLLPEAAIDYWINDLQMILHEDLLVEIARRLTAAGHQIVVKDHPSQFGFRQTALLDRLKAFPNVVIVPYHVSGNTMLAQCGISVTGTGTLGLQAALLGSVSVTGEAYYVTESDFVVLKHAGDLDNLVEAIAADDVGEGLRARQERIVEHLLRGSFDADFLTLLRFDPTAPDPETAELGRRLGRQLLALGPDGANWHAVHMPAGAGGHDGSPLN